MSFKYACFLSYRGATEPGVKKLYQVLRDELAQQTQMYMPNLDVYLDQNRLQGGDFFTPQLAHAICRSVCMVVLFSPQYFDRTNTTCAREYRAMETLERTRAAKLAVGPKAHGLIIPVVLRGTLPESIRSERHSYSLSETLLTAGDLRLKSAQRMFRQIADVIYNRYANLRPLESELCNGCEQFELPLLPPNDPWMQSVLPPAPRMPWR